MPQHYRKQFLQEDSVFWGTKSKRDDQQDRKVDITQDPFSGHGITVIYGFTLPKSISIIKKIKVKVSLIVTLLLICTTFLQAQNDKKLSAWGRHDKGQLGNGSSSPKRLPGLSTQAADWLKLSTGHAHGLGIKNDGTLWAWGNNSHGQLGDGTVQRKVAPVQIGTDISWVMVSAGYSHSLGVKSDGTLWVWGNNEFGQLGDGTTVKNSTPVQIGTGTDWAVVAAGNKHSLGIKKNGTLWAWGNNEYGQLGDNSSINRALPVQVGTATNWKMIVAGDFHSLGITDGGMLLAWGDNSAGQLGHGTTLKRHTPVQVGSDTDWSVVAAGEKHSLGIKSDGTLLAWGDNLRGQLGDGTTVQKTAPVQVGNDTDWSTITAGYLHSHGIKSDGTLWGWGYNYYGQVGDGTAVQKTAPVQVGSDSDWLMVSAGQDYSLGIKMDGTFWSWGDNNKGRLGDGLIVPGQIGTDTDWEVLAAGGFHSLGVKSDGGLWAWGDNGSSQLGDGTNTQKNVPVQVGLDMDWKRVAAGGYHSFGIKNDGTLWAWGHNGFGQLGDGSGKWGTIPVKVGSSIGWEMVAAGDKHSLGIKSDGTLWAWGNNDYGQLGDGTIEQRTIPVQIGGNSDWSMVSAGENHSLALKTDGTLWVWGYNNYGPLGATSSNNNSPVQLGTDKDWAMIVGGARHSFGLKTNGTLWAWGQNGFNQFGNGNQTWSLTPVQVGTDTDWGLIASGYFHGIGLKTDGKIWGWGFNHNGQLGDGTSADKNAPTLIGPGSSWSLVTAGGYHSMGLSGVLPENADLTSLTVSSTNLLPAFTSETTAYSATVDNPVSSIILVAVLADEKASVEVDDIKVTSGEASQPVALNVGTNIIRVKVTAQDVAVTKIYTLEITRENAAPVLDEIGSKELNEEEVLSFTASASDVDEGQSLMYALMDAPEGASIDASTGQFSWTPSEAQGPDSFTFKIKVTDNGTPALSDEEQITVIINEVNTAPVLAAISDDSYFYGNNISFMAAASDADYPTNIRSYSLQGETPAGASLNATTGEFSWTPGIEQLGSHAFTLRVTDNGSPALYHERGFTLTIEDEQAPAPPGTDLIVLEANYELNQVQYQQFSGTISIKNVGSSPISNFNVTNVYFSKDEIWDETDVYGGFVNFTNLEAGQTLTLPLSGGSNQFGIDADSEYTYFIVKADSRQEIAEADETNNIWSGEISIRNASVDLTVGSFTNNSPDILRHGEMLSVGLEIINNGSDNVHNTMYEYFLSSDEIFDETDTKIGYLNWIGFDWNNSAVASDQLAIPSSLTPGNYHVFVRINTQGQEININDYNLENNVVKGFVVEVIDAIENSTLNFNEPFGARSWEEDGHQWSWDNSGWDNIRDYGPFTGSGHAMSASGYSAKLSTTSLLDIAGLWVKTSGSHTFTHLRLLGYDKNDEVVFTKDLNPMDFEMAYAYVSLNWEEVKSIQFDYDSNDEWVGAEVFYDDMDYQFHVDNTPPSISCLENIGVCSGSELPDYRNLIVVSDDSGEFSLSQSPAPGTTIIETTEVTITATDGANNENSCNFTVALLGKEDCQPAKPSRPELAGTSDTGISNSDGITKDNTPEFYGTAEANSLVSVYINEVIEGSTTATVDGSWSYTLPSENALADGTYKVQVSATNSGGYESVVSDALTFIIDRQKPVVQTQNINLQLDATGNAMLEYRGIENGSSDNETAVENLSFSLSRTAFECADLGQSLTVVLTVEDQAGNNATKDATVSIVDQIVPELTVQDITLQLDNTGFAGLTETAMVLSKADNCSIPFISFSRTDFSCADAGSSFLVNVTATDASGNKNTASATVSVEDKVAPTVVVNPISVQLNSEGIYNLIQADIEAISTGSTDACGIGSISVSPNSFTCADVGAKTVNLTVTDENGNSSATTSTVNVFDETAPEVSAVPSYNVNLDVNGGGTISVSDVLTEASTDACGIKYEKLSKKSFNCTDISNSPIQVLLTVTDNNDNVTTKTIAVTVEDKIAPYVEAGQVFSINENVNTTSMVGHVAATDNCNFLSFSLGEGNIAGAFAINVVGSITVNNSEVLDFEASPEHILTVIVEDGAGNTSSQFVTVNLNNVNDNAPLLSAFSDIRGREMEIISFIATATDADNTTDLRYRFGDGAPAGAFLDPATGGFSWTPTEEEGPASYNFSIIVSDGELSSEQGLTITVDEVNQPPVITSEAHTVARVGEKYVYHLKAADADLPANTLIYEVVEIPGWLMFDPDTQILSGTPDEGLKDETYTVQWQVEDGFETVVQEFSIQLEKPTGLFDREQNIPLVSVYPNPTTGPIVIKWDGQSNGEGIVVSLFDMEGRLLFQHRGSLTQGTEKVSTYLQELKAGIYLLQLKDKEQVNIEKLIKK